MDGTAGGDINYRLRPLTDDRGGVEVKITLENGAGGNIVLQPFMREAENQLYPMSQKWDYEFADEPGYSVDRFPGQQTRWLVRPVGPGRLTVTYRAIPSRLTDGQFFMEDETERPEAAYHDCSVLFLIPLEEKGLSPVTQDFTVEIETVESVLTPWEPGGGGTYRAHGIDSLTNNLLAWGSMNIVRDEVAGTDIAVGFPRDLEMTAGEQSRFTRCVTSLFSAFKRHLGPRTGLDRLVVFAGEMGYPQVFLDSIATSDFLENSLFGLWNNWQMVPAKGGRAAWFQAGMAEYYSDRVAVETGLLEPERAFVHLFGNYERSLTEWNNVVEEERPSLADAEDQPFNLGFDLLETKGSAVCASMQEVLLSLTGGKYDVDWLLGELARRRNHFEGQDYSLEDIESILSIATGKDWTEHTDKEWRELDKRREKLWQEGYTLRDTEEIYAWMQNWGMFFDQNVLSNDDIDSYDILEAGLFGKGPGDRSQLATDLLLAVNGFLLVLLICVALILIFRKRRGESPCRD